jgi:hypothetical protein
MQKLRAVFYLRICSAILRDDSLAVVGLRHEAAQAPSSRNPAQLGRDSGMRAAAAASIGIFDAWSVRA